MDQWMAKISENSDFSPIRLASSRRNEFTASGGWFLSICIY
jgi:hypothetical protein